MMSVDALYPPQHRGGTMPYPIQLTFAGSTLDDVYMAMMKAAKTMEAPEQAPSPDAKEIITLRETLDTVLAREQAAERRAQTLAETNALLLAERDELLAKQPTEKASKPRGKRAQADAHGNQPDAPERTQEEADAAHAEATGPAPGSSAAPPPPLPEAFTRLPEGPIATGMAVCVAFPAPEAPTGWRTPEGTVGSIGAGYIEVHVPGMPPGTHRMPTSRVRVLPVKEEAPAPMAPYNTPEGAAQHVAMVEAAYNERPAAPTDPISPESRKALITRAGELGIDPRSMADIIGEVAPGKARSTDLTEEEGGRVLAALEVRAKPPATVEDWDTV